MRDIDFMFCRTQMYVLKEMNKKINTYVWVTTWCSWSSVQLLFPSTPIQTQTLEWPIYYGLSVREMGGDENWNLCAAPLQTQMLHFAHFVQRGFRVWKIDSSHIIRPARKKNLREFCNEKYAHFWLANVRVCNILDAKARSWISCYSGRKALEALLICSRARGAETLEWLFKLGHGNDSQFGAGHSYTLWPCCIM